MSPLSRRGFAWLGLAGAAAASLPSAFAQNAARVQQARIAPVDGSVLLITPASMLVVYPHVYKSLPYDGLKDVTPVSRAAH